MKLYNSNSSLQLSTEPVEIALAANAPYFCGMLVTACSIAKSARQGCRLSFNILDGGLGGDQKTLMERRVKKD